ncbi:hypothetical protein F5Y18DRAFT_414755 [Xylariaceae sp. FL1019]|nr:hypothetical protein F5Y18DRAFT_414755 [Xylariaceae sp. FL1019]
MSIHPLPDDVVAQIKSSTAITTLNGVICGLFRNCLDAGATKVTISVDYLRGGCSVEDDGIGIPPAEFRPQGGLAKLHFTSKYPAKETIYGKHGTFLASLASLSLLSITSHHREYLSHNAMQIHNSEVLARHTPSPPDMKMLNFSHGTRVTVRDLFGLMPVRVKQRALEAERGSHSKIWELLKRSIVGVLLSWPKSISVRIRESSNQWSLSFKSNELAPILEDSQTARLQLTSRVSKILHQSQLCDENDTRSWVPLSASVGKLTIIGVVSLDPIANKRTQFISIGILPVPNEHGTNVLYEEVNRVFSSSSFGTEEETHNIDDDERRRREKDNRYKTDGFTGQELKGRKGVDRWPMFYFRIEINKTNGRFSARDVEDILDEDRGSLKTITDLLRTMIYEFLKKHHFRPRRVRRTRHHKAGEHSKQISPSLGISTSSSSKSSSSTPSRIQPKNDLSTTRLSIGADHNARERLGSPFDLWSRIKSGPNQSLVGKTLEDESIKGTPASTDDNVPTVSTEGSSFAPLFGKDGNMIRPPFAELGALGGDDAAQREINHDARTSDQAGTTDLGEAIRWMNPVTKEALIIDPRTGFATASHYEAGASNGQTHGVQAKAPSHKKLRLQNLPNANTTRSEWLENVLSSWENPVFKTTEPPIPCAFNEEFFRDDMRAFGCPSVQGRVTKAALRNADFIAQVDRKFIFVKETSHPASSLLLIVDQHAADERCRVEDLMRDYFITTTTTGPDAVSTLQNAVAVTELLEKPIMFDVSASDARQLEWTTKHFAHWGIHFECIPVLPTEKAKPRRIKVTRLPPSITERCRLEPRLLIELMRKETWKMGEDNYSGVSSATQYATSLEESNASELRWIGRMHGCPQGILDMINSRKQSLTTAAIQWKAFDFFEVSQVKLGDDETRSFFEANEISSVCSGSDSLFLGSDNGYVRIIGPSWKVIRSFQAHETGRITHMRQVEGTSLLITVSEDLSSEPVLKVWALDKPVKKTGLPTCLSTISIHNGRKQFPVSAFTALDDLSQLAVGFANGAVTVIRGDLIHDRGTKQRIVYESEEPVTGIEFVSDPKHTTLFVATTSKLLKLIISGRGHGQPPRTVEDSGCAAGCMTLNKKTGDVIVVREDAVYYYTLDGRGLCFANDGATTLVETYQDYVALVSPPSSSRDGDNMRRRFGGASTESLFNAATFTMVDPQLQIVAHTETLISQVKALFQIWGDLFVLTRDGKINRHHEKSLQQRLELLYQRNLYPLAINLAQKSGMDSQQQNIIYRKYGDHLYQKGDYDSAMSQYIKAIDSTEPSQLKDVQKLENFIKSEGDLKFDVDTAIAMCRQGGYFEQAAYLATKHGESDLVVDILIEDSKGYSEALDFIWHLDVEVAYPCLMKYARVLLEYCPDNTTKLFVDYYTGRYKPRVHTAEAIIEAPASSGNRLAAGVVGAATGAAIAVTNLTSLLPLPYMGGSSSPATPGQTRPDAGAEAAIQLEDDSIPNYTPPPPRSAFSSFIDHPDEFIIFLEACLESNSLGEENNADIYTTLFEMYLHKAKEGKGVQKEEWELKAKKLIEGHDLPIENSNVLLLSHLSDFRDGTTLVKEQSGLLFDIFRSYTSAKDTHGAIRALRKYGPREPQLYPAALAYFTSDARVLDEAGPEELASVLKKIDSDGLMAPLQVIQTLGSNAVATMGMIKPYLHETITRERREIASNKRQIKSFRSETEQKRIEITELGSKPAVFQAQRCPGCGAPLDLPVVHFLCKHSFHQRCLKGAAGGEETECPVCAANNAAVRSMKRGQEERSERHDLFKDGLEKGDERFKVVAQWFGQGVMEGGGVEG